MICDPYLHFLHLFDCLCLYAEVHDLNILFYRWVYRFIDEYSVFMHRSRALIPFLTWGVIFCNWLRKDWNWNSATILRIYFGWFTEQMIVSENLTNYYICCSLLFHILTPYHHKVLKFEWVNWTYIGLCVPVTWIWLL